ncbi:MAG TPA: FAD:protein FMN transferase [Clostridiales bacterium]|nr:FAD:protein FMN transferase [Clostridiales bacterium]
MKKKFFIVFILSIAINTTACNIKPKKFNASFISLFNTVTEITGYANTKEDFKALSQIIYDNLGKYHKLYDKYNEYDGINNIKTINDNAGISPVKVDKAIIDLLVYSKEIYSLTNGTVNIALGPVLEIWHDYRDDGINNPLESKLPPLEVLISANEHTDINKVIIDIEQSTVYLEDKEMSLDVGAIAKGYATEQVALIAESEGYSNFLLSVGGNIRALGGKGNDIETWNVGIRNPNGSDNNTTLHTLSINDLSLVSSGDYERYYTVSGIKYHHIIDPKTLMPSDYFTAVTILCKDSGLADSLSTAIFNMDLEEGFYFIENLKDVEALWILKDKSIIYSSKFEEYIKSDK